MTYETIWRTALGELEVTLSKPSFNTWFRDTFIYTVEKGEAIIAVPTSFALEWLSNKYQTQILEVLRKLLPNEQLKGLRFKIAQRSQAPSSASRTVTVAAAQAPTVLQTASEPSQADAGEISLIANYTFDSFIVGTNNRLAHAASLAIASEPGKHHNPFFIYGGVGLGKTHLMHAIGNEIRLKWPKKRILYSSCERFANEFIQAIQTKKTEAFKAKYRSVDVLLIDDIQFLSGKEGTQEEFFHTFNALHQTGRQIILTSDRMPQAIPELEDRLSSRFVWGMVTDIKNPDVETRSAILKQKVQERGLSLDEDVIDLLARTFQSNIRELEGGLNQIIAHTQLEHLDPTLEVVSRILKDRQPLRRSSLSITQVFDLISSHYHVPTDDLLGPRRNKEFVHPRQIMMYILRHELNYSFPKIGRELGKDHTTVMHGVDKIERELPKNSELQHEVTTLKDQLYSQLSS